MPVLSVCIPTYNRAKILDETLFNLTNESVFQETNDVEIVISNNKSPDNTEEVCQKYFKKYPTKIKYVKQQINIQDRNFIEVLKLADGKYIKLQNDKNYFANGELEKLISFLKSEKAEKIIYFENEKNEGIYNCQNMEDFFSTKPFLITWINTFCCLREIFYEIDEPDRFCNKNFAQVDILIRLLAKYKKITIYSKTIFVIQKADNYGNYNFAKVIGENLLTILDILAKEKYLTLTKKTYEKFKKELLIKQINFYYFDVKNKYNYIQDGYFKYIYKFYGKNLYFYVELLKYLLLKIRYCYKNIETIIDIVLIILIVSLFTTYLSNFLSF